MPHIDIDGRPTPFAEGQTILEAARAAGIDIPTLCYLPGRPAHASCLLCIVRVGASPRMLPSCATQAVDGMQVTNDAPDVRDARRTAIELILSDHLGDCLGPCQGVCPAHMDIPDMMRHVSAGRFEQAIVTVKETIALPAILGRICPEICEKGCRRSSSDGALAVCKTKRFVADRDLATGAPYRPELPPDSGRSVGIVGAGPAGCAAAYYLRRRGHACTIYDDHEKPGGMMRYAIPRDILPEEVLDAEIGVILGMGAVFRGGVMLGRDASIDDLLARHDAVLLAAGDAGQVAPSALEGLKRGTQGLQVDRHTMMTSRPGVFGAGGVLIATRHAVRSVADGRAAAESIHQFLGGSPAHAPDKAYSVHIGKLDADQMVPYLQLGSRMGRTAPAGGAAQGFSEAEVRAEAARCLHCDCRKASSCQLRTVAHQYGASQQRFKGDRREFRVDLSHPAVVFEPGKCIACGICVRIAAEGRDKLGMGFSGRGFDVRAAVPFDGMLGDGLQETALACADACPTGALARTTGSDI